MPTYDYECRECGHRFELFQSITEPEVRKCPVCNKMKVRRLIGAGSGLIFRGSGFYCTDYREGSSSAAKSAKQNLSSHNRSDSDGSGDKS